MTADLVLTLLSGGGLLAGVLTLVSFIHTARGSKARDNSEAYAAFVAFQTMLTDAAEETADVLVHNPVAAMRALLAGDEDKTKLGIVINTGELAPLGVDNRYHAFACTCAACMVKPMTWCAGHDGLVPQKSMDWSEDGQRWRCRECLSPEKVIETKHDLEQSMAKHVVLPPGVKHISFTPTSIAGAAIAAGAPNDCSDCAIFGPAHCDPYLNWTRLQLRDEALRRGFDVSSTVAFPTKATIIQLLRDTEPEPKGSLAASAGPETPPTPECNGQRGNHGHPDVVCAQCDDGAYNWDAPGYDWGSSSPVHR